MAEQKQEYVVWMRRCNATLPGRKSRVRKDFEMFGHVPEGLEEYNLDIKREIQLHADVCRALEESDQVLRTACNEWLEKEKNSVNPISRERAENEALKINTPLDQVFSDGSETFKSIAIALAEADNHLRSEDLKWPHKKDDRKPGVYFGGPILHGGIKSKVHKRVVPTKRQTASEKKVPDIQQGEDFMNKLDVQSDEKKLKQIFDGDPELQEEFGGNPERYLSFKKAEKAGLVRIFQPKVIR